MKPFNILIFVFILNCTISFGQAGVPDSSFGINGTSTPCFPFFGPTSVIIDSQGKIITCGGYWINGINNFALTRYQNNGIPDSSFGSNGKALSISGFAEYGNSVVTQQDGKIIVCGGNSDFEIARYLNNGGPDPSFGGGGFITCAIPGALSSESRDILVQADGKIVVSGTASFSPWHDSLIIARFNSNGSLDNTFGFNGITTTTMGQSRASGESIAIQQDGKYVVGGWSDNPSFKFALVRYNSNGTLDNTFGIGGKVEPYLNDISHPNDFCTSVLIQDDGKIIMTGASTGIQEEFAILRFNIDGTIDSSFGNNGLVTTDFFSNNNMNESFGSDLQQDGKIIAVGYAFLDNSSDYNNAALARYNVNGSLDSTFGQGGKIVVAIDSITGFTSVVMQPDGKIVVAGGCQTYGQLIWRYLSGLDIGVIDTSVPDNPILIYPNPIHSQATLQYTLTNDEQITIVLYDMQGKLVQQFITNETRTIGKHEEVLHLNELLPAGSYILNIGNGKNSQGVKIVKE